MSNEVKIKLTDEQKSKIREATGKELPEIRVESFGNAPAVSHPEAAVSGRTTARKAARIVGARKAARVVHAKKAARKLALKSTARVMAKKAARKLAKAIHAKKTMRSAR